MSKYTTLFETVSVLLEDAACAKSVEEAQEIIEKARDLNDKAIKKLEGETCADAKDEPKAEKKDENDEKKAEAIMESVENLLNLAMLCESADDADKYIKMAEGLQKDIEDIPEETPVKDDEYPAEDVTGGEGKPDDYLEDIKDLVDGDARAMELLTKDPNTLTID